MRILFICLLCLLSGGSALAQKTVNVSGEYVYYPPENVSLEQAKETAVERAKIDAIAKEFGTDVSQTNTIAIMGGRDGESTMFNSTGSTEIKGEWIADTKEPEITVRYEGGMLVIVAKVWGKVRRKSKSEVLLSARVLCNGIESERFRNNDKLSIAFKSPVNGFLSIWLIDDTARRAYCLLPYENEDGVAREIKNNVEYALLSTADYKYPYREATILTTDKVLEIDRLIFIFSTNRFAMPLTDSGEYLPELAIFEFEDWVQRNRIKDESMQIIEKPIEIKK